MLKLSRSRKNRKGERGTAIVEAAFILPVLLLLLSGVLEFGQIFMIKQVITNAAREGARLGAINLDNTEALSTANTISQDYLERSGMDMSAVNVDSIFSELSGNRAIQVTINYDYTSRLAGWGPGISDSISLRSRTVMRREA